MASVKLLCFGFLIILLFVQGKSSITKLWVVYDKTHATFKTVSEAPESFIAVASFDNSINQTGWSKLDIQTNAGTNREYSDSQQAYAAGFVEGHITRPLMKMHWQNTMAGMCPEPLSYNCMKLRDFFNANIAWLKENIAASAESVSYWHHIELYLLQAAGLQDGYSNYPGIVNLDLDVMGVYMWQVDGDLEDLASLFPNPAGTKGQGRFGHPRDWNKGAGHCSALIRLLPGNADLYVSQDTWSDLSSMLRILKRYDLELHMLDSSDEVIPGHAMTFSSYPGTLSSGDDFYTISSGLVSQETTIGNSNSALVSSITNTTVLEAFRSMVANRITISGEEWCQIFSNFNSGTYNNQWMIVDYKRFSAGRKTPIPGTFYLLEQIPTLIHYEDMTDLLYQQSYFGSYNVAYFPDVFNKSGMWPLVKKYGDWFTYDKNPRALIYKRDVQKVVDLQSMRRLMRYNDFKNDPLSRCNCTPPYSAENAIACRDDLNPANGTYPFSALGHRPHIATDVKITTSSYIKTLSFLAESGPTYDDQPAFSWTISDYRSSQSHVGQPDLWMFDPIVFNGSSPMLTSSVPFKV